MSRKKTKDYLPVQWVKGFESEMNKAYNLFKNKYLDMPATLDVDDMRAFAALSTPLTEKERIAERYPFFKDLADNVAKRDKQAMEAARDFNSISLVLQWAKDKQCFVFDEDFINELLRTENLQFVKNAWKFLPYKYFYVDISSNKELCEKTCGKGFFITTELVDDSWYIHICKVTDELFFSDFLTFSNDDYTLSTNEIETDGNGYLDIVSAKGIDENGQPIDLKKSTMPFDEKTYKIFIAQILTFLSSVEPDVAENEETKLTYRKPAPDSAPKHKFSEVRKWDVGLRYGTAFRKWKKEKQNGSAHGTSGTGSKKRPHTRRAHWSHYWYGKGDNKVRRPKWLSETFVGLKNDTQPVTIHKIAE